MTDEPFAPPVAGGPAPEAPSEPAIAADAAMLSLPGARSLVAAGFDLLRDSRRDLTWPSVYFGLLTLLTVGPAVVLLIVFLTHEPDLITRYLELAPTDVPPEPPASLVYVLLAFLLALPALVAIGIDAELMAVGILASRHVGRRVSMEEALRRARQAFWRVILASFTIGAISGGISLATAELFGPTVAASPEISTLWSSVLGIAFGLPFAYLATGIVLGDAGPMQALGRSIGLARARPRLALVIALFTTAVGVLPAFALGAGGDTLIRIAEFLHLDFESGPLLTILSILLILAAVMAIGSLMFTISAVTAAPQVVAFLGLTHYSAGLDEARDVSKPPDVLPDALPEPASAAEAGSPPDALAEPSAPPVPAPNFWLQAATAAEVANANRQPRLVSWPMLVFAVLAAICAVAGFATLNGA